MKEIVESNKMIAEFMGLKKIEWYSEILNKYESIWVKKDFNEDPTHKDDYSEESKFDWDNFSPQTPDVYYERSWDWLMPVVERIVGLELPPFSVGGYMQSNIIDNLTQGIGIAHKTVVEFIKWYNQQES